MSKYKIGDVFVAQEEYRVFQKAEIVAFDKEGGAILEVMKEGMGPDRIRVGDLVRKSDYALGEYYMLAKPKPAFFEVGAFYRFKDGKYVRYEIKEIFETPQPDGMPNTLQAHAEASGTGYIRQEFLEESDFENMTKM